MPETQNKNKMKLDPSTHHAPRPAGSQTAFSSPQIHPDGRRVAFVVTEADFDESEMVSHLWLTEWDAPEDFEEDEDEARRRTQNPRKLGRSAETERGGNGRGGRSDAAADVFD